MKLGVAGWVFKGVIDALEVRSIPAISIAQDLQVDYSKLTNIGTRIAMDTEIRFWRKVAEIDSCPTIGLEISQPSIFGGAPVIDYVAGTAPSGLDSLAIVSDYIGVMHSRWDTELKLDGEYYVFKVTADQSVGDYYKPIDMFFGVLTGRMRSIVGTNLLERVEFQHESFGNDSLYQQVLGANVFFDCSENALFFSKELANTRVSTADPEIHKQLLGHLIKLYLSFDVNVKSRQVYFALRNYLSGQLGAGNSSTIEESAKALGFSKRSLQRRLQQIDSSFESIKRDVCVEIAEIKLREGLSIDQVADLLNYSSGSSLRRAIDTVQKVRS